VIRTLAVCAALAVAALVLFSGGTPSTGSPQTSLSPAASFGPLNVTHVSSNLITGYNGTVSSGYISKVEASWNVPGVTCHPKLDEVQTVSPFLQLTGPTPSGSPSPNVTLKLGTTSLCQAGRSTPLYYSWCWLLEGDNTSSHVNLVVNLVPGDQIHGEIWMKYVPGGGWKVYFMVKDVTQRESRISTSYVVDATDVVAVTWAVRGGPPVLPHFNSTVRFTDCSFTDNGSRGHLANLLDRYEYTMTDGSGRVMMRATALYGQGSEFKVTYVRSN
jgi:hypothetical protein